MVSIPVHAAGESADAHAEALEEAGCLVVTGLADADARRAVVEELAPHMESTPVAQEDDPAAFYPGQTRRVTALVARLPDGRRDGPGADLDGAL